MDIGLNGNKMPGMNLNPSTASQNEDTALTALSQLTTQGFQQDMAEALKKMRLQGEQTPESKETRDTTHDIKALQDKRPISEDDQESMALSFLNVGLSQVNAGDAHAVMGQGFNNMENFFKLQEAVVGLVKLAEDYANENAVKHLTFLWSKLDRNHQVKKDLENKFQIWSKINIFQFSAVRFKTADPEQEALEKTHKLQFMMYISFQYFRNDENATFIDGVLDTPEIQAAVEEESKRHQKSAGVISFDEAREMEEDEAQDTTTTST